MDNVQALIKELETNRRYRIQEEYMPSDDCLEFYSNRVGGMSGVMFVPHKINYKDMLSKVSKGDVVCDMGAGDLRFALMASKKCRKVYAVEMCPEIVSDALKVISWNIPRNFIVVCADWRFFPVPDDVTFISCMVNMSKEELPVSRWKRKGRRVFYGATNSKIVKELNKER